jgi:hypothetical protein
MSFNAKDELNMPYSMGANYLSQPKTHEMTHTDSYHDAMKSQQNALFKL